MAYIEARLIVPTAPNISDQQRKEYPGRLHELERNLAYAFGGYTTTEGSGAWDDGKSNVLREPVYEPVRMYLIAYNSEDAEAVIAINSLRSFVKARLGQQAVYLSRTVIEEKPIQ